MSTRSGAAADDSASSPACTDACRVAPPATGVSAKSFGANLGSAFCRTAVKIVIVGMNDRLHGADLRMAEKGGERRTDHRLAGYVPVLLGNFATGALAPAGCDDHSRDLARHECISARDSGIALAHVPEMCEQRVIPQWPSAALSTGLELCVIDIAVQHLRWSEKWLNYMQMNRAA